jgi:ArsR family transcriptional regulator
LDNISKMAEILKLLADRTRLTILSVLRERELCVCEIVEILETTQPNISQHLRKLKAAGLVSESRRGQWVYYSLSIVGLPYVQAVMDYIPSAKKQLDSLNHDCTMDDCCE